MQGLWDNIQKNRCKIGVFRKIQKIQNKEICKAVEIASTSNHQCLKPVLETQMSVLGLQFVGHPLLNTILVAILGGTVFFIRLC